MGQKKKHRFAVSVQKAIKEFKRLNNRTDSMMYGRCVCLERDNIAVMWFRLQNCCNNDPKFNLLNLKRAVKTRTPEPKPEGRYEGAFNVLEAIGQDIPTSKTGVDIINEVNIARCMAKAAGNTVAHEFSPAELYNIQKDALDW